MSIFKTEFKCFFGEDFEYVNYVNIKPGDVSDKVYKKIYNLDKDIVDSVMYCVLDYVYLYGYNDDEFNLETQISYFVGLLPVPPGINFDMSSIIMNNLTSKVSERVSEYADKLSGCDRDEVNIIRSNMIMNILKCGSRHRSAYLVFKIANLILKKLGSNFCFGDFLEVKKIIEELIDSEPVDVICLDHDDGRFPQEKIIGYNIE